MQHDYATRLNILLQRARQLKRGVSTIRTDHVNNLLATGRNDIVDTLLDIVQQLDTIESSVKPKVVGLAGNVAAGKSSFLNQLVGDKVVPTYGGSTTAVLTEISFIPGNEYRATVHFVSVEEMKKHLRDMAAGIPPIGQPNNDTPVHSAQVNKLAHFFDFGGPPHIPPHPSTDDDLIALIENPLFRRIGAVPEVFVANNVADLFVQINPYIRFVDGSDLPYAVNRVCIEGPFKEIPPGVVLVDTPGLNDRERVNSQRTINAISSLDEVWFATDSSVLLANETDLDFLSRALINNGRHVQIVSTKFDSQEENEKENSRSTIRDNLRKLFAAHMRGVPLDQANQIKDLTTEEKDEINERLENIGIEFTGIPPARYNLPPFGFDYWRQRLAGFGSEQAETLTALERSLNAVEQTMATFGTVKPAFVVPQADYIAWRDNARNQIHQFHAALAAVVNATTRNTNNIYIDAQFRGNWSRVWHHKQKQAVMSPAYGRRGRYVSPTHVGLVDVNEDIANAWIHSTRNILRDLQKASRTLAVELQRIANNWNGGAPQVAIQLLQDGLRMLNITFGTVINNGFLGNIAANVQTYFTQVGVYRYNRNDSLPLSFEVFNAMNNVTGQAAHAGLGSITALTDYITNQFLALANPIYNVPEPIRLALAALLAAAPVPPLARLQGPMRGLPDIEDITCSITLQLFEDPVQTVCGHVFERAAITDVMNSRSLPLCPLCRADLHNNKTALLPRQDIVELVRRYREYQTYVDGEPVQVDVDSWWIQHWRDCCDEYRARLVDEAEANAPPTPPDDEKQA